MPTPFRSYLVKEAAGIAAFNATVNAGYTWYLWRSRDSLPLLGADGVGLDLALTPVIIAALSALIGTAILRRKIADGRIVVEPGLRAHPVLHRLPHAVPARAAVAAALAGLILALPLWALLPTLGDGVLTPLAASGTKAGITVVLSLVIVPILTLAALADVQREVRPAPS